VTLPTSRVECLTPEGFTPLVGVAAQIYGEAMRRPPELVVQRRELIAAHLQRRGFVAAVARADSEVAAQVVGFAYGYRGRQGEWWHDVVARGLGRSAARRWLTDAFELAELHVAPPWQGHGLGRELLELVLDRATGTTAILSTHDIESAARGLYRSIGFVDPLRGFVFPGSEEVYAVMGKRLHP
jgi:ribosomal protein S18 acetylase RimI-like enzyme